MTKYRVSLNVEYLVDINEANETVPGPPALQGNSEMTALHRATWVLCRSDIGILGGEIFRTIHEAKRPLGVKYLIRKSGLENVSVIPEKTEEVPNDPDVPIPSL